MCETNLLIKVLASKPSSDRITMCASETPLGSLLSVMQKTVAKENACYHWQASDDVTSGIEWAYFNTEWQPCLNRVLLRFGTNSCNQSVCAFVFINFFTICFASAELQRMLQTKFPASGMQVRLYSSNCIHFHLIAGMTWTAAINLKVLNSGFQIWPAHGWW